MKKRNKFKGKKIPNPWRNSQIPTNIMVKNDSIIISNPMKGINL